jgi:hypothetical protein
MTTPRRIRSAVAAASALLAASCGQTGGKLIQIGFRAGGVQRSGSGAFTFQACVGPGLDACPAKGWTVTLQTARIALGPFYFNTDYPPTQTYRGGTVIIEATEQTIVDVLDPTLQTVPGGARGETGTSRVAEIGLLAPDSQSSISDQQLFSTGGQPETGFGYVAGTATNGTMTVPFAGRIAVNPSRVTQRQPLVYQQRVNGADANLIFAADTTAVSLRVDPSHWFDQCKFAPLLGGTPVNGSYTWEISNCVQGNANFDSGRCAFQNALYDGVQLRSGVFQFALTP